MAFIAARPIFRGIPADIPVSSYPTLRTRNDPYARARRRTTRAFTQPPHSTLDAAEAAPSTASKADMGLPLRGALVDVRQRKNEEHNCRRGKERYLTYGVVVVIALYRH